MSVKRILVVDDDTDMAEGLCDVLDLGGCTASYVSSCEEALHTIQMEDFDVVVMDVNLPGLNGFDGVAELRKIRPGLQIFIMTGLRSAVPMPETAEGEDIHLLYKPFPMHQLLDLVTGKRSAFATSAS